MDPAFINQPVPPDAVRMVGIRKVSGEHLVRPVTSQTVCCYLLLYASFVAVGNVSTMQINLDLDIQISET